MDDTTNNNKRRNKKSKKKNRSASQQAQPQPPSQAQADQPTSTSNAAEADPDSSNAAPSPKHEWPHATVPSSNGHCPQEETSKVQPDVDDSHIREELDAAHARVSDLQTALDIERANSHALRYLIEDFKASQASSEASFRQQIKQLTEDMLRLRVSENYQQQNVASLEEEIQNLKAKSSRDVEINEDQEQMEVTLRTEIQRLTEENFQLRAFHKHENENETMTKSEVEELRKENFQLKEDYANLLNEVEEMKDTIDQLFLERRQLTAKLVTMQTGTDQLEREAASVDEDSHIQAASAVSMVERLAAENSALVQKVNDQSALIDLLTRKYNYLMGLQSNGHAETVQSIGNPTLAGDEILPENEEKMRSLRYKDWKAEQSGLTLVTDCSTSKDHENLEASAERYKSYVDTNAEVQLATISVQDNDIIPAITEIQESPDTSILVQDNEMKPFTSTEDEAIKPSTLEQNNDIKPFSDAPIMGAPIRLFSFIARYVSGADLVKVND